MLPDPVRNSRGPSKRIWRGRRAFTAVGRTIASGARGQDLGERLVLVDRDVTGRAELAGPVPRLARGVAPAAPGVQDRGREMSVRGQRPQLSRLRDRQCVFTRREPGVRAEGVGVRGDLSEEAQRPAFQHLSLIHISEPTRQEAISYAVFCLKKRFF